MKDFSFRGSFAFCPASTQFWIIWREGGGLFCWGGRGVDGIVIRSVFSEASLSLMSLSLMNIIFQKKIKIEKCKNKIRLINHML